VFDDIQLFARRTIADSTAALIGGIVGGAIALLLIGALIAFYVVHCRRNRQVDVDPNAHFCRLRRPTPTVELISPIVTCQCLHQTTNDSKYEDFTTIH
jgi:hypothetical protein